MSEVEKEILWYVSIVLMVLAWIVAIVAEYGPRYKRQDDHHDNAVVKDYLTTATTNVRRPND